MIATLNAWGGIWAGYFGLALIQHTLFLGVIFLGLYLARNAPAGLRYSLCFLGMAKLLLPPFMPAGFLARAGLAFSTGAANPASGFVTLLPAGTLPVAGPEGQLVRTPGISPAGILLAAWACAVLFHLAGATISYVRLRRELKAAVPVAGRPGVRESGNWASGCSGVAVFKSAAVPVALTFGLLRPRIYVPEAWDEWSDAFRRMVIAHETAHLKTWDRLGRLFQAAVKTLYFFHPLAWLLDRRMDSYREMMCDDAVTERFPGRADEYSRCLVAIAERVMNGPVCLNSASAFLKHRNGLMERVRYQLEVGKVKRISARTRILTFAGLLMLVLPLSWYCADAETKQGSVSDKANQAVKVAGSESSGPMEKVELAILSGDEVRLDGKKTSFDGLHDALESRFPAGRDNVVIRLSCGADAPMERVSMTHRALVDLGLLKVIYEGGPEEGLPMILPTPDLEKKLQTIAEEHAMSARVVAPGFVDVDGERIKTKDLKQAVEAGLAEDPYMVVSLSWAPAATYDDFVTALADIKAGGVERIAVQMGE
ncbi:MAG: M56 family metallopeptidase [bacterium]